MPVAVETFLKIVSSTMERQRKVARRRRNFLKYGTFQIQEIVFPLLESNPLLENGRGGGRAMRYNQKRETQL